MGNDSGKEIDLHVIVIDNEGNGLYGPPEAGEGMYPADALGWKGTIGSLTVRCMSPEFQIGSHSGYELGERDIKDVAALAEKFALNIPEEILNRA